MLKIVATALLAFLSFIAYAQYSLSGIVRSKETGQPLPGASVLLLETSSNSIHHSQQATMTDEFGSFRFQNVNGGVSLTVTFIGYSDYNDTLNITANTSLAIELNESAILTEEVVVSATRATEKTPTTYSTLSKEKIQKQNFGQDLPFLLNWTPSVVTTSDAGTGIGYTGIRIRGSDATRINVTINGIPYNDSESLGTFWVDVPDIASSSQSIQIQRGVGTSTNGAGAFGASINLQTTTRNETKYIELTNAAGFFRNSTEDFFEGVKSLRTTLSLGSGLVKDHWIFDGRISKIRSDGFIDRASADLASYYAAAGYHADKSVIKVVAFGGKERTYQSWYGVPESRLNNDPDAMLTTAANEGWNQFQTDNLFLSDSRTFNPYVYENQVDDYKQNHLQLHVSHRFNESITLTVSPHYTNGKGYYEEYRFNDDFDNYNLPPAIVNGTTVTSTDLVRRRWLDNDFYGAAYSLYLGTEWNLIFGGAWNRYDGDHFGQVIWTDAENVPPVHPYYFNNGDKRDFSMYLKGNIQDSRYVNVFWDMQVRQINYRAEGIENKLNPFVIDKVFLFVNPKVGLTITPSEHAQVYASYAQANREPVRDDFVDNPGAHPKAETLHNIELGYRGTGESRSFQVNCYLMRYKDQLVLTGELNDVGASVRTNVDDSYRMGVELEGAFRFSPKWQWNGNITLSRNKIQSFTEVLYDYGLNFDEYNVVEKTYKDTDISFSPGFIAGSSLSYFPVRGMEVTWLSKYVGKQFLDNTSNNDRRIDPYFVNDVRITFQLKPRFTREINFSVLINNILNEEYESNGYTWGYLGGGADYRENYYYPQVGRNVMMMVGVKL
jgi:iron complex outermembrane recepter protein